MLNLVGSSIVRVSRATCSSSFLIRASSSSMDAMRSSIRRRHPTKPAHSVDDVELTSQCEDDLLPSVLTTASTTAENAIGTSHRKRRSGQLRRDINPAEQDGLEDALH